MKRPLALTGAAAFVSLSIAVSCKYNTVLLLAIISASLCAFSALLLLVLRIAQARAESVSNNKFTQAFLHRVPVFICVFLTAAVSLSLYCEAWYKEVEPYLKLDGEEVTLLGEVTDYPIEEYGRFYYFIDVERVENEHLSMNTESFTVRLSSRFALPCKPGEHIRISAQLYSFDSSGLYSTQNARFAEGAFMGAYLTGDEVEVVQSSVYSVKTAFADLRRHMARTFRKLLPDEEASLICLMLLGEKNNTTQSFSGDFNRLGIYHLLVISALHMTAISGFIIFAFERLPFGRVAKSLLTILALLCFLTVIGFPYPAVRSAIMCSVILLSNCFGRQSDSLNSLGLAVLLICLFDPFAAGDVGFTMSVCSSWGIIVMAKPLRDALVNRLPRQRILRRLGTSTAESVSVSISVTVFNLPVILLIFGGTSLVAPLANLIFIPVSVLLLYISFASAFLSLIPWVSALTLPLVFCAGLIAKALLWAADLLSKIKGIYFAFDSTTAFIVLIGLIVLLSLGYFLRKSKLLRRIAVTAAALLFIFGAGYEHISERDSVEVIVSGEEEANVLLIKNSEAAVLSLGGYQTDAAVYALADSNAYSVGTVFLPVQSAEAVEALSSLTENCGAEKVLLPEGAYIDKSFKEERTGVPVEYIPFGGSFEALDGVEVTLSKDGSRLDFLANGISFIVETGESEDGFSQVLITNQRASKVNSTFTVLSADDIMVSSYENPDDWDDTAAGSYVFATQIHRVRMKVSRDGEFSVRREY